MAGIQLTADPVTLNARAQRLLRLGLAAAVLLHDAGPQVARESLRQLDPTELLDLATLLAACVDIDQPESELHGWWTAPVMPEHADEPGVPPAANEARERECPQVNAGRTAAAAGLREHWAALYPDGTWTSGENRTREEAEEIIGFRDRLGVVAQPVLAVRWESDWRAFESEAD